MLLAFFIGLLMCVTSLPVAQDSKSVQLLISAQDTKLIKRTSDKEFVHSDIDTGHSTRLDQSFDKVPLFEHVEVQRFKKDSVKRFRRTKRDLIVFHECPRGMLWFARTCMTFETYERLLQDEDEK